MHGFMWTISHIICQRLLCSSVLWNFTCQLLIAHRPSMIVAVKSCFGNCISMYVDNTAVRLSCSPLWTPSLSTTVKFLKAIEGVREGCFDGQLTSSLTPWTMTPMPMSTLNGLFPALDGHNIQWCSWNMSFTSALFLGSHVALMVATMA